MKAHASRESEQMKLEALLQHVLFWRHNQTNHKRLYSPWERSFLCQRCGTITEQE